MQRYFSNEKKDNLFILSDNDIYHIKTVMRMKDHEHIQVVYQGEPYLCILQNVNTNLEVVIESKLETKKDSIPTVTLIVPLLKEQKFDFILQKSTELGVSEIIPVVLTRSIIKLEKEKELKKIERWKKIVKEASEQSYRNEIPNISNVKEIDELKLEGISLVCSTNEDKKSIKYVLENHKNCDKINVLIGPEGGLTEKEEQKLKNIGFIPVTLGSRILRVETVPIYILSIINYESME